MRRDLPFVPADAEQFSQLMLDFIWKDQSQPTDDGGMTCWVSIWYDDWNDAREVAKASRMMKVGLAECDGCTAEVWGWASAPEAGTVSIWNDGSAFQAD